MRFIRLFLLLALPCLSVIAQPTERPGEDATCPQFIAGDGRPYDGDARALFRRFLPLRDGDEWRLVSRESDAIGFVHERYAQYHRKVRVEGGDYVLHLRNGTVASLTGHFRPIPEDFDVHPSLPAEEGLANALRHVGARVYAWEPAVRMDYPGYDKPVGDLVVWAGYPPGMTGPRLAWKFDIHAHEPLYRAHVFIDAASGAFLGENRRIHEANAPSSGTTLFNGTQAFTADLSAGVYRLRATAATGGVETYSLNNGTSYAAAKDVTSTTAVFTADPTANQAHWGTERTLAYFKAMHNRSSYNNQGAVLRSYVHYSSNFVNAFWDGSRMTYGDGDGKTYRPLVSLDIVGHEITHGVTQFSADLAYRNESGALNESFSDIFGEAVEHFAKGGNDWLMGCDIGVNGCGAIRSLKNPNAYRAPDTYGGSFWHTGSGDNGGVHTNSGVQNKWFYILAMGESGTNDHGAPYAVAGIGLQKAAAIAYRNLAYYLTATSTYANARTGAIQSAVDLYGAGSPEVVATTNAWYAVGVGCAHGQVCYCPSKGDSQADEWIAAVTIGTFRNASSASPYSYYPAKTVTLRPGRSHKLTLTPGYATTPHPGHWRIWIDYNRDSDFDDPGELAFDAGSAVSGIRTGAFTVPATASGSTRMRIAMKYNAAPTPCEAFKHGEVEDYPVVFGAAPPPDTQAPTAPVLTAPSRTQTTVSLSWTASTDKVGVVGYDVYVDHVRHHTVNSTGRSYTVTGLSAGTTYTLAVRARDAAGHATPSNTLSVTTLGPVVETTVGSFYFPSSLDGWSRSSAANGAWTNHPGLAWEGPGCLMLRGSRTTALSPLLKLKGQTQVEYRMYFTPRGFESGKAFSIQYTRNAGKSYVTAATLASGSNVTASSFLNDAAFYLLTITLDGIAWNDSVRFRIRVNGADASDQLYFDAITIKGRTHTTGTGTIVALVRTARSAGLAGLDEQRLGTLVDQPRLQPNPVKDRFRITGIPAIREVRIYSAAGALVHRERWTAQPDVSGLSTGSYIAEVETPDGRLHRWRFVKE